ncbi:MAG TPA: hypothetical protein VL460_01545 [Caulobacteraceae bacterium]|jgi:hypothetical protein|nr:hypothetical protein [Caulobacteraceae bacterium]
MTKSTLLAAAAASLLALPAVAWSQPAMPPAAPAAAPAAGDAWPLAAREDWLIARIKKAQADHEIADDEAARVLQDVAANRDHLALIATRHPTTPAEKAAHETRLNAVAAQIHWLREGVFQRPW